MGRIDPEADRLWRLKPDTALLAAEKTLDRKDVAMQLEQQFLAYVRDEDTMTHSFFGHDSSESQSSGRLS